MLQRYRSFLPTLATFALLGCTGQVGLGEGSGTNGAAPGAGAATGAGAGPGAAAGGAGAGLGSGGGSASSGSTSSGGLGTISGDPAAAGVLPLQRLTPREYLNTVRDLLTDSTRAIEDLPSENDDPNDPTSYPFRKQSTVAKQDAALLQGAGEVLAKNVAARLSSVLPCTPASAAAEASCADQFISTFGPKAYRRPLDAGEVSRLTALYQTARTTLGLNFNAAIALLVEAILQSPGFLYHWELDPGPATHAGSVVQLGPYQMANRLAYFLWESMPDTALFSAAAQGQLATPSDVEAQARRMLKDPKTSEMIADFVEDWLDVDTLPDRPKDMTLYPSFATVNPLMEAEVRSFASSIFGTTGRLEDLLTGTSTQVSQPLAAVYKVSGVTGNTPRPVTLDATQRSGLLTLAGFLAVTGAADGSHPVRRGKAVYTRLLCGLVPPPPADVVIPPVEAPTPGTTTRQRFEKHDQLDCAKGCHLLMDPIGFAFEHYDGIGTFRTTDNGQAVDSHSSLALDGTTQPFADAVELSHLLASSAQVRACFAKQLLRFAADRPDTPADLASIEGATNAFASAGNDIRELIVALATSRTFRYRTPAAGEIVP